MKKSTSVLFATLMTVAFSAQVNASQDSTNRKDIEQFDRLHKARSAALVDEIKHEKNKNIDKLNTKEKGHAVDAKNIIHECEQHGKC